MTITGNINRWAILRTGNVSAAVTRVTPDAPDASAAYIVELRDTPGATANTFHITATWRDALRVASDLLTDAVAHAGHGRTWE